MLFMVIETFKPGALKNIYERFHAKGRMMPDGLNYVNSWITEDLGTCYQLMETDDSKLFNEWIANWNDLGDFQVIPVMTSPEAKAKALGNV
jgi:hypothetical protein